MEHVIVIPKTTLVRVLQITLEKAVKVCCLGSFLKKPILQNLSYVKEPISPLLLCIFKYWIEGSTIPVF